MTGFKQFRDDFVHANRHRILNGFSEDIQKAAKDDAQLELQPPTGKEESGDKIKLRLIYNGPLDPQQLEKFKRVVDKFSKPGG